MKKIIAGFLVIILSCFVIFLGFDSKKNIEPHYYYQVYLDDQVIGVVRSKKELEKYIDEKGSSIKEKYGVDKVYAPNGMEIRKVITYDNSLNDVEYVYNKISSLRPFTIEGFQYTIKKEKVDDNGDVSSYNQIIYTVNEEVFDNSLKSLVETFVGKENLEKYLNNEQEEIVETGSLYSDIYIDNDITRKEVKIPVDEEIYTNEKILTQFMLYSTTEKGSEYVVQPGDTIESVAIKNKINVQEFLTSNPEFTSKDNMLYTGQVVSVAYANPVVDVISNVKKVEDRTSYYKVEERPSNTLIQGYEQVIQDGENGLNRVTQTIVYKNGMIEKAKDDSTTELKPSVTKIVLVGTRYVSGVGGRYWSWPTNSYSVSSTFGWRWTWGERSLHTGIDISSYIGAPIYATNNGVVTMKTTSYGTYGYFLAINHNNGYGSAYAHLNGFAPGIQVGSVVERGQLIGYMGNTGRSTGPHLHFEIYVGSTHPGWNTSAFINPYYFVG